MQMADKQQVDKRLTVAGMLQRQAAGSSHEEESAFYPFRRTESFVVVSVFLAVIAHVNRSVQHVDTLLADCVRDDNHAHVHVR